MKKSSHSQSMTNNALKGLLSYSTGFILTAMILLFVLKMVVDGFHYTEIFTPRVPAVGFAYAIGIGLALSSGLTRFALGLGGAYEFAKGKVGVGIFGLIFSFGMTIWQAFEVANIVSVWANGESGEFYNISNGVLQFVVWAGWILEIRLAFHISGTLKDEQETEEKENEVNPSPPPTKEEFASLNGQRENGQFKEAIVNPQ
jgi:hypothetical protein